MIHGGVLFVTQLLSMFAGMTEINLMAWHYITMIDMAVMLIYGLVYIYGYNAYWTVAEDSSASTAEVTDAEASLVFLKWRKTVLMTLSSANMLPLYIHFKPWMMAQWVSLPEETQMEWKEKKAMDKDHEMEEDEMMYTLFGF